MTTRTMTLSGAGLEVDLISASGVRGQRGLTGTGLPPVRVQWLDGAGDGSSYRGARILPRELLVPVTISAAGEDALLDVLSDLARILAPDNAPARLTITRTVAGDPDPVAESWWVDVVRTDEVDWPWGEYAAAKIRTRLRMTAPDPYFTRDTAVTVDPISLGADVELTNPGDAPAWPVWTIDGPCTGFTLISPTGRTIVWTGTLTTGQTITVDARAGTVVDHTGANRYAGLAAAPRFWAIPPGFTDDSTVTMAGTGAGSQVAVTFYPRRWAVI